MPGSGRNKTYPRTVREGKMLVGVTVVRVVGVVGFTGTAGRTDGEGASGMVT
jgi:hypothetical protein